MVFRDSEPSGRNAALGAMPDEQCGAEPCAPALPAAASDQNLMEKIAGGDQRAFQIFARRHVPKCLAISQRLIGNASDAEEIVQDAMIRIWRHAPKWRHTNAHVTTWLYRIVANLSIDYARKQRQRFVPLENAEERPDLSPSAQAAAEGRQLEAFIVQAIAALPPRQRMALTLCYFEEMDCAQAARAMGISVSAMESLLVRGRHTLKMRLCDRGLIEFRRSKPGANGQAAILPLAKVALAGI